MYQNVRDVFTDFTAQYEGAVLWMYLDFEGFVTVGVGNKIDPIGLALAVEDQFVDGNGNPPSDPDQAVTDDWNAVHAFANQQINADLNHKLLFGFFKSLTSLRMSDPYALVLSHADGDEQTLGNRFPDWGDLGSWPADAQMAVLSMSYAMGPGFNFPHFVAACQAHAWKTAASESHMSESGNPGVAPRNVADRVLLLNAQYMADNSLAFDTLQYSVAGQGRITLVPIGNGSTDQPGAPLVSWVQNRLIDLGYIDQSAIGGIGTFDQATEDAVRQLQGDYQLSTDGRVGLKTYAAAGSCIPASEAGNYTS